MTRGTEPPEGGMGLDVVLEDLRAHQLELELQNQELRAVQAELEEALQRYRELYDRAPVGYLSLDPKGVILQANLTAAVLLGMERGALRGMGLASLVVPEDQDRFFLEIRGRLSREGVGRSELRLLDGEGGSFWAGLELSVEAEEGGEGKRAWCTLTDLTERVEARVALAESRDSLRKLASRLQEIREEERTTLARELHDGVGQSLAAMGMDLAWLQGELGPVSEEVAERIGVMRRLVVELVDTITEHMVGLRPPELDLLGLSAAVEHELASLERKSELEISADLSFDAEGLDRTFSIQLLRIFEESVSNVLRHADAKALRVSLKDEGGELVLEVEDDGGGISEELVVGPRSFGLMSMRERAASVGGVVATTRGTMGGTLVRAAFPLPPDPET